MPSSHKTPEISNKYLLRRIEIAAAFHRQGWSDDDRRRYLDQAGVDRSTLEECDPDQISEIYFRMIGSRMIGRKVGAE
jgi:hypothetical protein